jgi:hypothetical protein
MAISIVLTKLQLKLPKICIYFTLISINIETNIQYLIVCFYKMKIRKYAFAFGASVAVLIITLLLLYSSLGYFLSGCGYAINSDLKILDSKYIATVYTCDCGATTRISVHVSLRPISKRFNPKDAEDVFIADGIKTATLAWTNENKLVISIPKGARIFRDNFAWKTVQIEYKYE